MKMLSMRSILAAGAAAMILAAATAADAKPFKLAVNAEATTLDPHAQNAQSNFWIMLQAYEPLVARDAQLKPIPALATRWEAVEPTRWRFHLRPNVKFHDGSTMTADDVVFSYKRAMAPTSNVTIYIDSVSDIAKVDDVTVDLVTKYPDAVLPEKMSRIFIMSKAWAEANKVERPQNFAAKEETFAVRNMNGTGPYVLKTRELDRLTLLVRNPAYWGQIEGNVTEYHHVPIVSDATRVAALLAGDVDALINVPSNDVARLKADSRLKVIEAMENRTMFLAFNQAAEELPNSNVKGKNPFKDKRVREAVAHAIDIDVVIRRVLRGQGMVSGSMWTHFVNGWDKEIEQARRPVDREKAKKLLAEAGYPNGFEVQLDCPPGAYDEVCLAFAPMLAQVGITLKVVVTPAAQLWPRMLKGELAMYGLTWGVPTYDAMYTLRGIMMSQAKVGGGSWNGGRYSNGQVDSLIEKAQTEPNPDTRRQLIKEAHRLHNEDVGHLPMYHLMIPWAMSGKVTAPHRADNQLEIRYVKVD
ncbi:MAG: ABC transporter substrate-binding protein [Alphaproteobacteria bacterium]|nr:ABC transporter substrate-binding protein [Alphaproteobacteria bacterium]